MGVMATDASCKSSWIVTGKISFLLLADQQERMLILLCQEPCAAKKSRKKGGFYPVKTFPGTSLP